MLELFTVIFVFFTMIVTYFGYPVIRHWLSYRRERESLEKRYNRIWRSRRDLLVSIHPPTHSFLC